MFYFLPLYEFGVGVVLLWLLVKLIILLKKKMQYLHYSFCSLTRVLLIGKLRFLAIIIVTVIETA